MFYLSRAETRRLLNDDFKVKENSNILYDKEYIWMH